MKQYLKLVKKISKHGIDKPAAREGMPDTTSLFGPQIKFNLQKGFPLVTTKKMYWKGIVTELVWFLRGSTNIKYLVDHGCNIWNEDAYNYYLKRLSEYTQKPSPISFVNFISIIKSGKTSPITEEGNSVIPNYTLGDCGFQYGKVWRDWETQKEIAVRTGVYSSGEDMIDVKYQSIDQIANLIHSLRDSPQSRRHIVTAIDPVHDQDLALYWCHALFQFNARPLTDEERLEYVPREVCYNNNYEDIFKAYNPPKYYLDCKLYQRSADAILGVPFNIASYALLIEIIAKIVNMVPGKFIHTFGDVHIYHNHITAVVEQISRKPCPLPRLEFHRDFIHLSERQDIDDVEKFSSLDPEWFRLLEYQYHPIIKAKLSTGLK